MPRVLALLSLVPLSLGLSQLWEEARLGLLGHEAEGIVEARLVEDDASGVRHVLRIRWEAEGAWTDVLEVTETEWRETPEGTVVAVTYLPGEEAVHQVGRPGAPLGAAALVLAAAGLLAAALLARRTPEDASVLTRSGG